MSLISSSHSYLKWVAKKNFEKQNDGSVSFVKDFVSVRHLLSYKPAGQRLDTNQLLSHVKLNIFFAQKPNISEIFEWT